MNGMLQHPDAYRDAAERRQQEARGWAEAATLGRLAMGARRQYTDHPTLTRVFAVVAPAAAAVAMLTLFI